MNEKQIAKLLSNLLAKFKEKYFTPMEKRLEPLEAFTKDFEPFDDSALQEKIKAIPEPTDAFDPTQLEEKIDAVENYANDINDTLKAIKPYDDLAVLAKIDEVEKAIKPYDDSAIQELIHAVKEDVNNLDNYDDSAVLAKIAEVEKSIPTIPEYEAYDDSAVLAKIDEVEKSIPLMPEYEAYDDSAVLAKIDEVEKSIPLMPEYEAYDDSAVLAKIDEVEKSIPLMPEIPKEYDDSEVQKSIHAIQELHEKEIAELKAQIEKPIKIKLGEAKSYDGSASEKGQVVLHDNNVYVNRIKDNGSAPCDTNNSYQLLMKAPKAPIHLGVWDNTKNYELNDMVMWNNHTWIKADNEKQEIPSEGWKLVAKAVSGRRGAKGEAGDVTVVDYAELLQKQDDEIEILKSQVKGLMNETRTN